MLMSNGTIFTSNFTNLYLVEPALPPSRVMQGTLGQQCNEMEQDSFLCKSYTEKGDFDIQRQP